MNLVQKTVAASYYQTVLMKTYLENSNSLVSCHHNSTGHIYLDVPKFIIESITSCYNFGHKYPEQYCQNYCQDFSLTKLSVQIDGNLQSLKQFFSVFKEIRQKLFKSASNNVLMDGIEIEENALDIYLSNNFEEQVVYKTQ